MIARVVLAGLLAALAATTAISGSAIKGSEYRDESATKGERLLSPAVEHQRRAEQRVELSKTRDEQRHEFEQHRDEQLPLTQLPEQKLEEFSQQREEPLAQQKEEILPSPPPPPTKGAQRYEAKPQVQLEEAKGAAKFEEKREEALKAPVKLSPAKTSEAKFEQQRDTAAFYEQNQQQQQQQQQLAQQVELKDYGEQRRLEDQSQYTQQQAQQFDEQQRAGGFKGAAQVAEPEPYAFDYSIEGSSRRESGDTNGVVRGQYTLQQPDGSSRIVDYVADRNGFRASVNTNEFGTESGSPANIELRSSQPAAQDISLRLEGKTREFLAPPSVKGAAAPLPPARPDNWNVKGAAYQQEQLQQVAYVEEAPRVAAPVKGAKLIAEPPTVELRAPETKGAPPALPLVAVAAPAKGSVQRLDTVELAQTQTVEAAPPAAAEQHAAPVKSAELRTAKAIGAELRPAAGTVLKARSTFESATAHRPVVGVPRREHHLVREAPLVVVGGHVAHHRHVAPALARGYVAVPPAPVRAHYHRTQPVASVLRSQLQHDRYPPNPIYSRVERPLNPRVSFYSNNAAETANDEAPLGFEASS